MDKLHHRRSLVNFLQDIGEENGLEQVYGFTQLNKDNLIIKDNFPIPTDETYDDITEEGLIEGGGR